MSDGGPGWVHHEPPPRREPVVVSCGVPGCASALAMPPGTPLTAQATRLEIAGWTCQPDGLDVCGVDHTQLQVPPAAPWWWRRWRGAR